MKKKNKKEEKFLIKHKGGRLNVGAASCPERAPSRGCTDGESPERLKIQGLAVAVTFSKNLP